MCFISNQTKKQNRISNKMKRTNLSNFIKVAHSLILEIEIKGLKTFLLHAFFLIYYHVTLYVHHFYVCNCYTYTVLSYKLTKSVGRQTIMAPKSNTSFGGEKSILFTNFPPDSTICESSSGINACSYTNDSQKIFLLTTDSAV